MPQEFHVLKCYQCCTFQVHQVKKSQKWSCKLCGEKQSIIKVYGQGSGADCRKHVQKLNITRGEIECERESYKHHPATESVQQGQNAEAILSSQDNQDYPVRCDSKWTRYVENEVKDSGVEEGNIQYTTDRTQFDISSKTAKKEHRNRYGNQTEHRFQPYNRHALLNRHDQSDTNVPAASATTDRSPTTNSRISSAIHAGIGIAKDSSGSLKSDSKTEFKHKSDTNHSWRAFGELQNRAENKIVEEVKATKTHHHQIKDKDEPGNVSKPSKWAQFMAEEEETETQDYDEDFLEDLPTSFMF